MRRKNPRGCHLWGFLVRYGEPLRIGCCCLFISVQPFAYVAANYTCYNRDKKCGEQLILSWTHTSFLLEVRQRLQHITFYIDILQFSINENYDRYKKRSCMEVPYSFMTCPGIEPGFTP